MLKKPESADDLSPPFEQIGEPGWSDAIKQLLADYEVPLPEPTGASELADAEKRLAVTLPADLKAAYAELGPLDLAEVRLLRPSEFEYLTDHWSAGALSAEDQRILADLVHIADSPGGPVGWDRANAMYSLVQHDPDEIVGGLLSFSDLLRSCIIDLAIGYHGWPDLYLVRLTEELKDSLFGDRWF
jgi:hypothetical protein